jgi:hypothetical protein
MVTGVTDGYHNNWNPDTGNSAGKWPVVECKLPTLWVIPTDSGWAWTCSVCHDMILTEKFVRPKHKCLTSE